MAGVEHDQRPRIGGLGGVPVALLGGIGRTPRPVLQREVAQERLAVDRGQIEHQARRLAVDGVEHEGLVDAHRPRRVDHDARAAGHDEAEAERLDEAAPALAGPWGEVEHDLRQVDHHPVGVGEREGGHVESLRQVDDEARAGLVAAEAGIATAGEFSSGGGAPAALWGAMAEPTPPKREPPPADPPTPPPPFQRGTPPPSSSLPKKGGTKLVLNFARPPPYWSQRDPAGPAWRRSCHYESAALRRTADGSSVPVLPRLGIRRARRKPAPRIIVEQPGGWQLRSSLLRIHTPRARRPADAPLKDGWNARAGKSVRTPSGRRENHGGVYRCRPVSG